MSTPKTNLSVLPQPKPDESAIKLARQLLERCESGETIGFIAATVDRERTVGFCCSDGIEISDAYYGLRLLGIRLDELEKQNREVER